MKTILYYFKFCLINRGPSILKKGTCPLYLFLEVLNFLVVEGVEFVLSSLLRKRPAALADEHIIT